MAGDSQVLYRHTEPRAWRRANAWKHRERDVADTVVRQFWRGKIREGRPAQAEGEFLVPVWNPKWRALALPPCAQPAQTYPAPSPAVRLEPLPLIIGLEVAQKIEARRRYRL